MDLKHILLISAFWEHAFFGSRITIVANCCYILARRIFRAVALLIAFALGMPHNPFPPSRFCPKNEEHLNVAVRKHEYLVFLCCCPRNEYVLNYWNRVEWIQNIDSLPSHFGRHVLVLSEH